MSPGWHPGNIWMRYDGTRYYYVTNLQGDVVAILDANGNSVVQYTYDAWGKVLSITGSMADTIGTINPLLYRGYIYDHDTGLYFLQTRYYNPTIGRFICADVYVATGQGFVGNNMFAYCLNNPVYLKDSFGTYSVATIDDKTSIMDKFFRAEGSGGAAYAAVLEAISLIYT